MDIPRGHFSSIKRDIPLSSILAEMAETSFSGYAMANHEGASISLVFSEGACILAEYQDLQGVRAWDAIKALKGPVEVALYLLTDPQISLAAEFNVKAAVPLHEKRPKERPVEKNSEPAPSQDPDDTHLQVPRGKLIEIRQDEIAPKILEELDLTGLTGYAIFNLDSKSYTLVFSGGTCVLAEGGRERGTPVLKKVQEIKVPGEVAIYSLTNSQLALAQEFNQGYQVEGNGGNRLTSRPIPPARRHKKEGVAPTPSRPATQDATLRPGSEKRPKRKRHPKEPDDVSHEDPVLKDLAALDAIDADQMAVDLKENYISILDRLELGHLVGKDKKKGVK